MLPTIKELRAAAGGLDNLTDEEILSATYPAYQQYYGSMDDFAKAVGYGGAGRGMAGSRISAGVDSYQAGLYGLGGAIARRVGADAVASWMDRGRDANEQAAEYATQRARDLGAVDDWRDVNGVGSALNFAGGLAAQSLPYAAEALVGGLAARGLATGARAALRGATTAEEVAAASRRLGAAQTAGGVAASYPSSVADILSNQREAGGEDLGSALVGGVPYAALNAFGVEGLAARGLRPLAAGEGRLARMATGALSTAIGEGVSETGQEVANQYFGRMAVDPNETLFNDEANRRYVDSFVGGAALGGLFGGAGGFRRPRTVDEGPLDLTQRTQEGPAGQLGFSPLAGTPVVFPDGSVALNGDQELQARYNIEPYTAGIPNMGGELAADGAVVEKQQAVQTPTKSALAISQFDEVDQGLTDVGIPLAAGKKTREKQRAFYQDAVATGIPLDSDLLTPYWTAVSQNRFGDRTKVLLQNAIVQSKKDAANVSQQSAPVGQPVASSVGGSAAPVGGVGNRGPVPNVVQPAGGDTGNTQPAGGQAASVADAGVQRPAAVGENTSLLAGANPATPRAGQQPAADPFQVGTLYEEDQNQLEIAKLTGQGGVAEAIEQEATGQRADAPAVTNEDAERIIGAHIGQTKTAERDRKVLDAWLATLRSAGYRSKGKIKDALAKDFGVSNKTVERVANIKKLTEAAQSMGYTEEQAYEALGIPVPNAKAGPVETAEDTSAERKALENAIKDLSARIKEAKGVEKIELEAQRKELKSVLGGLEDSASEQERGRVTAALSAAGFSTEEGSGFGLDDSRYWQKDSSSGNQAAEEFLRLGKQVEDIRAAIVEFEQQGLTNVAVELEGLAQKIKDEAAAVAAALEASKPKAAPKREVSADLAAAKEKFKSVGRDVTKMEPEELRMLRGEAERFKNKELLAKIDAQLGVDEAAAPADEGRPAGLTDAQWKTVQFTRQMTAPTEGAVDLGNERAQRKALDQEVDSLMAKLRDLVERGLASDADIVEAQQIIKSAGSKAEAAQKMDRFLKQVDGAKRPTQDSGQALWESLRQANTQLVGYDELTNNERGYLTELADRTNGKPVIKNELGLQELMKRTSEVSLKSRGKSRAFYDFGDLTDDVPNASLGGDWLAGLGVEHAMDYVSDWETFADYDKDAIGGEIVAKGGRYTVRLNEKFMDDSTIAAETITHEIGHAVDMAPHGGIYSSQQEMSVTVSGGKVVPVGAVARELHSLYESNDAWREYFEYPFDLSAFPDITSHVEVEGEIFAQLFSLYANPRGRAALERRAPVAAAFMAEVIKHVQSSKPLQLQTEATVAQRTVAFKNRNAGRGGQVDQQAAGRAGQARFASRGKAVPDAVRPQVEGLTKVLKVAKDAALNTIVFSEDLFKRAASMGIDAAMDMDRIYRERSALTGNIEREVTRIENLFNRIPNAFKGTGANSANRFLYDSTREGKWGFAPKWRGADAAKVTIDAGMANRFKAMPKEAQEWVRSVLEHGDKMLKLKKDTLLESTNTEYDALIADAKARGENDKAARLEKDKASSLRQFQRLFSANEFNPYAPMRRFGNWVVTGKSKEYMAAVSAGDRAKVAELEKDPDHYHVSFAESYASALELQRELQKEGHFESVPEPREKEKSRLDMYGGLMSAFNQLRENIESELGGATDPAEIKALRAARETVIEMYLQSLAENSARKAEMRRRGVAGEIDMLRSFSTQGRADAHFLAASKFNPQASQTVVKMRQQKNAAGNETEKSMAFNEVMARHEQSMKYENGGWFDAASKASRVTSLWMLATSPMYYLQNMTQPFVLSLPFMAGKHDYTAAAGQIMRSFFQMGALIKSAKPSEGFDFTKASKDKAEQDMILKLVDRGRIDIGMDTELGRVKLEGDSVTSKAVNRGDQFLRSLSQKVEAINRVSTALAAYRLERKAGASHEAALEYADQVISQTHGDYTRINAPRAFNSPAGKVALQFRKFQLIQLTLLAKLVHNSFGDASPAEKAAARKILTYTLAHTGVLAGVVGMPGFAAAAFIINKLADLFGDDDEPYNLENELRKMLGGGELAQVVMRGVPNLMGTDLSGKLGMGNALSILPYTDFDASREGFNAIATGLTLGATGGVGARVFQALGDIKDGDYYRGLMGLAPKGVADAMRAFVEANRGETNKKGDVLVSADEISNWESFAKLIGWPTSNASERRFDRQVAYDNKEAFDNKASKLKNQYSQAVREGDADNKRKAIEGWQRLQQSRREAGFQPQPLSALMKAPQEQRKRERNTSGGVQFDKRNRQFVMEQTQ